MDFYTLGNKSHSNRPKKRKPGDFFEEITGKAIGDCETIEDIDKAVEQALGLKLPFTDSRSRVVYRIGDVFKHVTTSTGEALEAKINNAIKR